MNIAKYNKSQFKGKVEDAVRTAMALREHQDKPVNVSFSEIVQAKFNVTLDSFYNDLGIDPGYDTIQNITVLPDLDVRWIIPEIFRDSIQLGLRRAPIYPNIIAAEEQMKGLTAIMPHINMSDAAPKYVGEGETIPLGSISYGQKSFNLYKIGRGIRISREVTQYSSLNVVSVFLQDFGIKLGHAMDVLAIDCLINGEQLNGSESAPVIGTANGTSCTYKDLLKIWIRMSRIGRMPTTMIGGEAAALETLDLDEFKLKTSGTTQANLTLKTPVPASTNYFIHGNVPDDQQIILDPSSSIIKFNAQPLLVESEKIVSNQTEAFYVTLTTGFAKLFRDSALIVDNSDTFVNLPFPTWMDLDAAENVTID